MYLFRAAGVDPGGQNTVSSLLTATGILPPETGQLLVECPPELTEMTKHQGVKDFTF